MPFELYLRADDHSQDVNADHSYPVYNNYHYDDANCHYSHGHHPYFPDSTHYDHHHPHGVQFRIPQFMLNGPPILAPGGGAEVLPAGLLDSPNSLGSSWFANSGLAPFHSALNSRQGASGLAQTSDSTSTNPYHPFHLGGPRHLPIDFASHFASNVDPHHQPLPEPPPSLEVTPPFNSDLVSPSPASSSVLSGPSNNTSYSLSNAVAPKPVSTSVNPPSSLGLPVYSVSGFDVLSILSRVVNRSNPTVELGPVDLSCSFIIADVQRYDCPIVYASPTFCRLTGYSEKEVLGRNCRFLQSPTGVVTKGEQRKFASPEAVSYMRKLLSSSKECQTSLINYRKGGHAFINLVTVIPLKGGIHNWPEEADEVIYHVGFQVDLTEQPVRILDKLRNGTYYSGWGSSSVHNNLSLAGLKQDPGPVLGQLGQPQNVANLGLKGGRHGQMMSIAVSKELRNLIADKTFTDSVPISTGTNISGPNGASSCTSEQGGRSTTTLTALTTPSSSGAATSGSINRLATSGGSTTGPAQLSPSLSLMLLELLPDFLLVLSLKGAFLYVAPSVRLVLGYEPHELVGRGISDVCHPADLVPLMRELKEGSVSGVGASGLPGEAGLSAAGSNILPRPVDLLFRAMPKTPTLSPFPRAPEASSSSEPGDSRHTSSETPPSLSASPSSSSRMLSSVDTLDEITSPYVWLECRGRLHIEPGKGRKAIILSGRARWMPVVRWASVRKAGASSLQSRSADALSGSLGSGTPPPSFHTRDGQRSRPATAPSDSSDFWALLSLQGTILIASASVRDVLGWGVGEVVGRSIWAMVGDGRNGVKARVEAELAELEGPEMDDPPPTIVTTSLVHKEARLVQVRLLFYRTPRSHTHSVSGISHQPAPIPLVHPRNNPLCPIVCQVVALSSTEYSSGKIVDPIDCTHSQVHTRLIMDDEPDVPSPLMHPSGVSLFEELNAARGSSWQYELQQLKFANERLHEELHALEGAVNASSTSIPSVVQPRPSSAIAAPPPQILTQTRHPQFTPLIHATLPTSLSSRHLSNSLHEQAPPPSEWSSLAGANGQGPNPLKRAWHSEDGPMT